MVLESNDSVSTVNAYYLQHLASGDWTITSGDTADGAVTFQLTSRPQTVGSVNLLASGQHTEIQVVLDS
jgi:hypothetical protein